MKAHIDLQLATEHQNIPTMQNFRAWVEAVLALENMAQAELTIRLVDTEESQSLNFAYRQKNSPTNVLSFEMNAEVPLDIPLLGDLVICAPVVASEALQQNKPELHHWAHMVIHGTLHLFGYDHITDEEAEEMETVEKNILQQFDIPNPYFDE
ncbi:rRNA maturation RNase YbeY [Aliidiomarina quisquiliarum]|uniref:rRNA maturation RNase YbeY n=1 Tax=Aliidiomarina quisquiliarum TaxID=2938947 RepID=UPI00208E68C3|nr:rRNA maturation RNase YbeY [Aliidiomarina quisquiliarum]MCO4321797.1 rRNA maturation RNase YbeY [Aliidiomarina quisquiliarum]